MLQTPHSKGDKEEEMQTSTLDLDAVLSKTGTPQSSGHFCRIRYHKGSKKITEFLYLGQEELFLHTLNSVTVGKSISFLNNIQSRWEAGAIPDIVTFLADTWSSVMFYSSFFPKFVDRLKTTPGLCDKMQNLIAKKNGGSAQILNKENNFVDTQQIQDLMESMVSECQGGKNLANASSEVKEIEKIVQDELIKYLSEVRETSKIQHYYLPEPAAGSF